MNKKNLYLISLEPIENRYTAQWKKWIQQDCEDTGIFASVVDIDGFDGRPIKENVGSTGFLDFVGTNIWKSVQIQKIAQLFEKNKVKHGDKFLFYDAWHYGAIALRYMSELNGIHVKIYGMWHAGSYDPNDLLGQRGLYRYFYKFEEGLFDVYDKSFVATEYHKDLICQNLDARRKKIHVTGFPYNFSELDTFKNIEKENLIVFPHRLSEEKQPHILKQLEEGLNCAGYEVCFCQENKLTKEEYHVILAKSKMMFSANLQETWGIGTFEAMYLKSIPWVPDRLSYSEMYAENFLYPSEWTIGRPSYVEIFDDIIEKLEKYEELVPYMDSNIEFLKQKYCTFDNIKEELHGRN